MKTPSKGRSGNRSSKSDPRSPGRGPSISPRSRPGGRHGGPRQPASGERPGRSDPDRGSGGRRQQDRRSNRFQHAPFQVRGELLFGRNAILETLRSGRRTGTRLWVAEGMRDDVRVDEIVERARSQEVLVESVPRPLLDDMLPDVNHQGVLLEAPDFPYADLEDVIERPGTVLMLDHVKDPQNFGTLLRAADAAGVAGVVIPADRSVSVTAAVVNASAGAVAHLEIALVANLGRAIDKLEASGRWTIGLAEGDASQPLFETDIPTPVTLIVGSEGSGLTANIRNRCQLLVSLPMRGTIESLNAATAGSIALYDILRRDSAGTTPDHEADN